MDRDVAWPQAGAHVAPVAATAAGVALRPGDRGHDTWVAARTQHGPGSPSQLQQQRYSGMQLLDTMINLRAFLGAENSPPVRRHRHLYCPWTSLAWSHGISYTSRRNFSLGKPSVARWRATGMLAPTDSCNTGDRPWPRYPHSDAIPRFPMSR